MDDHAAFTVTDDDTAVGVGSGSLPVLGTPRLLAWCEAATCAAIEPTLATGETRRHPGRPSSTLAASPVGARLEVTRDARCSVDGRLHRFSVVARDTYAGRSSRTGEVTRVVVDAERFLGRL